MITVILDVAITYLQVQNALKGLVVLSAELEDMGNRCVFDSNEHGCRLFLTQRVSLGVAILSSVASCAQRRCSNVY